MFPNYILTSKSITSTEDIRQSLSSKPTTIEDELITKISKRLVSYEWISNCVQKSIIVDNKEYRIAFESESQDHPFMVSNYDQIKEFFDIPNQTNSKNTQVVNKEKPIVVDNRIEELLDELNSKNEYQTDINLEIDEDGEQKDSLTISSSLSIENSKAEDHQGSLVFLSQKTCDSNARSKNSHIISQLQQLLDYNSIEGKKFEAIAYAKAISQLRKMETQIVNLSQIESMKYIGLKIRNKIAEILSKGKTASGIRIMQKKKTIAITNLCKVWGIGLKQANDYYNNGMQTIQDLKDNYLTLPHHIQKGLKYYDDLQKKIPREEIDKVFSSIKEEVFKILPKEILNVEVCGSYRRGRPLCGDIDVIISRKDDGLINGILITLVEGLKERKLIVEELSGKSDELFMGVYQFENGPFRRIDIKAYPQESYPFALLYFTGSIQFNISLRLLAKKTGYHLSDKELIKNDTKEKIKCYSERDIFDVFGLKYKEPFERDI